MPLKDVKRILVGDVPRLMSDLSCRLVAFPQEERMVEQLCRIQMIDN